MEILPERFPAKSSGANHPNSGNAESKLWALVYAKETLYVFEWRSLYSEL